MGRLHTKEQNNKINGKVSANSGCQSEQYPWISFRSMTRNARYDLSTLRQGSEREQTLSGLYRRLTELTGHTWLYWTQQPKRIGLETMKYDDIQFEADANANLTKDTTLYIFRFDTHIGEGKGRIIGYKNAPCAVYHIIGYDIDFSAYNHGK